MKIFFVFGPRGFRVRGKYGKVEGRKRKMMGYEESNQLGRLFRSDD
jgi:hypothetical protein